MTRPPDARESVLPRRPTRVLACDAPRVDRRGDRDDDLPHEETPIPITRMFWEKDWNRDLHVLRGQTGPNLAKRALKFAFAKTPPATGDDNDWAADYIADHPGDVELRFMPLFNGVDNGHLVEGLGLHVDISTGEVRVDSGIPGFRKSNFIVEVTAKNVGDGSTFHQVIRFHIHWKVVDLWITPAQMTVRPANAADDVDPDYRFTVIAEFDDGSVDGIRPNHTVGDVTLHHGVTWKPDDRFDDENVFLFDPGDQPGDVVQVSATLSTPLGPQVAQAEFHIAPSWAQEPHPPRVSMIPGGGFVGVIEPEEAPNILFIGDGFPASPPFEAITNAFVHSLKSNAMLSPFNVLATSMFFWRAFVAGPKGISVRCEVYFWSDGTDTFARAFPGAVKPAQGTEFYTLQNLLYVVGLPTPGDMLKSNDDIKNEWKVLNFPDPTGFLEIDDDTVVERWKAKGNRAFIDQIDAFPAMSYGRPPAANADSNYDLELHRERGYTAALGNLYPFLASDDGTVLASGDAVGALWAGDATYRFNNTSLVVLVTSVPGGRAGNFGKYIALSSVKGNIRLPVTPDANRKALILGAIADEDDVSADSGRVLAHELAHSFGLGDEYSSFATRFPDQGNALAEFANLTTKKNLWNDPVNQQIVAEQIKWNWHRIAKAAVIAGQIDAVTGGFRIPLRPGEGFQFDDNDQLLLRLRQWGVALQKNVEVLAEQKALKLMAKALSDAILVEPVVPGSVTLAELRHFAPAPGSSIVYAPTRAKPSIFSASPYARLMVPSVMHEITAHHRPLTDVPCDPQLVGPDVQIPDLTNIDMHDFPKVIYPTIVGLYEGGNLVTCDIFHPTGVCMMNNDHSATAWFCAVCKYVIVDFVNPYLHSKIDQSYTFYYPPSD